MQSRYENALVLRKSGRLEEAIREFHLLALETPDVNWKATLLLDEVRCYADLERLDEADRLLQQIGELTPTDAIRMNVSFVTAWLSAQRGDHEKAALQYGDILQEYERLWDTPKYYDVYEEIRFRRTIELARSGEYREAIPLLTEAASFTTLSDEDQQEVHLWLGICYEEISEYDRATKEFLAASEFSLYNESEANARYRLARLYFLRGGFAQAKHQLEAVLRDYKDARMPVSLKSIYRLLSDTCYYLGEKENADQYAVLAQNMEDR